MFDLNALIGGVLIGLSAALLFTFNGRILGVSGILAGAVTESWQKLRGTVSPAKFLAEGYWRLAFALGMLAGGGVFFHVLGGPSQPSPVPLVFTLLAGTAVGFGTREGWGCTSGHGVCGISRLSVRSVLATLIYIGAGMLTVAIVKGVG